MQSTIFKSTIEVIKMNSHQGFQTAALAVLCVVGVVLATQLSSITGQYTDAKAAQEAALAKANALKAKGEARITLGDAALGIEYLNSALSLNPSDDTLRARLAEISRNDSCPSLGLDSE